MLCLIVAVSKNYVIGNKGNIPWKIKGEQKRFKELTTGNTIIMGRRSYDEIGHPLPNRKTILISTTKAVENELCTTAGSLQEALSLVDLTKEDVYVAGGAMLYKEALPLVERMYITHIDLEAEGDTFFPRFNEDDFIKEEDLPMEGEIPYRYTVYRRKTEADRAKEREAEHGSE